MSLYSSWPLGPVGSAGDQAWAACQVWEAAPPAPSGASLECNCTHWLDPQCSDYISEGFYRTKKEFSINTQSGVMTMRNLP